MNERKRAIFTESRPPSAAATERRVLSRERKATVVATVICCLLSLLCTFAVGQEVKQELKLTAAEILARSASRNVRLSADGKSIELIPGMLIEDDGAAAGFSYKPNEEVLSEGTIAVKRLQFASKLLPEQKVWLLVGHSGKELKASINGQAVELPEPTKAGNYWKRFEIPSKVFRVGVNEIALSGDGKLWIARTDDVSQSDLDRQPREQCSYRIRNGESSAKLGPKSDIEGEYYVRLLVDGYSNQSSRGSLRFTVADALNLTGQNIVPHNSNLKGLRVVVEGDWPEQFAPGISIHTNFVNKEFQQIKGMIGKPELIYPGKNLPRWFDVELTLGTAGSEVIRLRSVRVVVVTESPNSTEGPKILAQQNPPIVPNEEGFPFEDLSHERLAEFRKRYALDEVIKDCTTDLQRMEKLAIWSSKCWTKGHLGKVYPQWDALDILKKHEDGTPVGGFCQQFNIVFLQACESVGLPGRCVSIGAGDHGVKIRSGHEVVEIWSNEHNKWIYVDGQAAWYFVDKETRTPLNLLELRERQLFAIFEKAASAQAKRPVDVVVLATSPYEWKGLQEWPAFAELRMIPHTQFLDGKLPLPLNQGMRGWFWTGHRVWTDDLYPGSVLYKDFVASPHAWNWPINQTHLELQQSATADELSVKCTHNMPGFAKYAVQRDDQPEQATDKHEFTWPLHEGENRLQVRAVNVHGVRGPASWIKVSK